MMSGNHLRIAHLTDLHLTDGPRLDDQAEVLAHIVRECARLGVQATLLTGDLYGRTVPHRSTPAERAVLYPSVRQLSKLGPVVVIPGNHDFPGDLDTLAELGGGMDWPVVVQNTPQIIQLSTPSADLHVYAVPWPTKRNLLRGESVPRAPEVLRQVASEKLDRLLQLWGSRVTRTRARRPAVVHMLASHCMTHGARTSGGEVLTGHEIELSRPAMEALGVDYGALGHLHYRQESASRCWYGGDPWAVDFGETDRKGWHLVDVAPTAADLPPLPEGVMDTVVYDEPGRNVTRVAWLPTPHRRWITLDWRWAADHDDGSPRWVSEPTLEQLDQVPGAEVRARLAVPQQWVAGCPWDQVVSDLRARGAHRLQVERMIEPVHRVRAPAVATAETEAEKLTAYWGTLGTPPDPADAAAATALLADLLTNEDEAIQADTDRLLTPAQD